MKTLVTITSLCLSLIAVAGNHEHEFIAKPVSSCNSCKDRCECQEKCNCLECKKDDCQCSKNKKS